MRVQFGLQIVKCCSSLIYKSRGEDQSNLENRQQMQSAWLRFHKHRRIILSCTPPKKNKQEHNDSEKG